VTQGIPGTQLLDPKVIDDPYPFYRQLRAEAPVWEIPGTGLFTISTLGLVAEAAGRTEDFSSNITCLLYRDGAGLPGRFTFGDAGVQALATADPACWPRPQDRLPLGQQRAHQREPGIGNAQSCGDVVRGADLALAGLAGGAAA
jgi:hypothetical protein